MSLHDRLRAIRARPRPGNAPTDAWPSTSQTSYGEPNAVRTGPPPPRTYPTIEPVPLREALTACVGFTQLAPFLQSRTVACPLPAPAAETRRYFIPDSIDRSKLVFLDLETTGLGGGAGNMAFLVGLGRLGNDSLQIEQVLLQDYPGEPELLAYLQTRLTTEDVIISYNGLSFDCALLRDRFALHGHRHTFERQFDLLYPVRSLYRRRLSNCSLSTVESELLNIRRPVDLPGAFAPERYFEYLRQGDLSILGEVCAHHVQDVWGLSLLWSHLEELCGRAAWGEDLDAVAAPAGYVAPADPVALGRLLFSARRPGLRGVTDEGLVTNGALGDSGTAATHAGHAGHAGHTLAQDRGEGMLTRSVYDQEIFPTERREAGFELGRYYNSCGRWNEAHDVFLYLYEELHDRAAGVEVAKILEHRWGDLPAAAGVIRELLRRSSGERGYSSWTMRGERSRSKGGSMPKTRTHAASSVEALRYRLARLERKMARLQS